MFFIIILFVIFFVLFSNINVYLKKKENIYYIKLKINVITIIDKEVNKLDKKKRKSKVNIFYKIQNIKENMKEIWKIFLDINKKINVKKCQIYIFIKNNDYIKLSYYMAIFNAAQYMLKNVWDKIDINYTYVRQKEFFKFDFDIHFNFRLYNIIINLLKAVIIIIRNLKKGKMKNGTTSDRKFNGNCNVFY